MASASGSTPLPQKIIVNPAITSDSQANGSVTSANGA